VKTSTYTTVLVCDFQSGLLSRILDVYRFFRTPPEIILVRRGGGVSINRGLCVHVEAIPLPIREFEESMSLASALLAMFPVMGYLASSLLLCLKIRLGGASPRLVHARFVFPEGLFGLVLARLYRVPLVISAEGSDVNVMMRKNAVLRAICRFVLAQADVAIAVSNPLQKALQQFGITNSIYLPNSVDTSSISPRSEFRKSESILFVGSMTTKKRALLLLRAFERVVMTVAAATLIMVGDGPLRKTVQEETRRKQLDGRVKLFPRVTPGFVVQLLSQAGVFVLPSVSEGLSHALLEAMAAGKVIVASSNESHKELFRDGHSALLFRLDDEKDLAEQVVLALTNEQLRSKLSRSARELCLRQFSNTEIGPKLERIYLASIQGTSRHKIGSHVRYHSQRQHEVGEVDFAPFLSRQFSAKSSKV